MAVLLLLLAPTMNFSTPAAAQSTPEFSSQAHRLSSAGQPDRAHTSMVSLSFDTTFFPSGIVLGGDVDCKQDGTLRFLEKHLELCVGSKWHVVALDHQ